MPPETPKIVIEKQKIKEPSVQVKSIYSDKKIYSQPNYTKVLNPN